MNTTWTPADEIMLQKLQEQKKAFEQEMWNDVYKAVDVFYYRDMIQSDLVDNLIEHADVLVTALKPFCKEPQ